MCWISQNREQRNGRGFDKVVSKSLIFSRKTHEVRLISGALELPCRTGWIWCLDSWYNTWSTCYRKCLRAKYTTHSSSTPMWSSLCSYTLSCASILPLLTKRKASVNITSWPGGKVIPKEYYNSGKPRLPLTCFGTSSESKSKVLMKWGVVGWLQLPL